MINFTCTSVAMSDKNNACSVFLLQAWLNSKSSCSCSRESRTHAISKTHAGLVQCITTWTSIESSSKPYPSIWYFHPSPTHTYSSTALSSSYSSSVSSDSSVCINSGTYISTEWSFWYMRWDPSVTEGRHIAGRHWSVLGPLRTRMDRMHKREETMVQYRSKLCSVA